MEDSPIKSKTSKKRAKAQSNQEVESKMELQEVSLNSGEKQVKVQPKMPFATWFHKKMSAKKVRFWEDESILIFFKKQGLTEIETEDAYESVFKHY